MVRRRGERDNGRGVEAVEYEDNYEDNDVNDERGI